MAITITTLNNEAAAAKTFTSVSQDRGTHEWYNSTDASTIYDGRFFVKQSILGKDKNGVDTRRALVQSKATLIDASTGMQEEIIVNFTITTPARLQNFSTTQRKDLVAYIRNFAVAAVVDQLCAGEI